MENSKPKENEEIRKSLKSYWREFVNLQNDFVKRINVLQSKMNDKLKLGINLEFFYVEGECVGIGAEKFEDREKFPLYHGSELFDLLPV